MKEARKEQMGTATRQPRQQPLPPGLAALTLLVTLVLVPLAAPAGTIPVAPPVGGTAQGPGMTELSIRVDGLSCPFCAYGLEKKLKGVEHVASVQIEVDAGRAVIRPEEGTSVELDALERAVKAGGFTPRSVELAARGALTEFQGAPALSLPGDVLVLLADDDETEALVSAAGGSLGGKLVEVRGTVEFDHVPEGHAGHPYTLKLKSFKAAARG